MTNSTESLVPPKSLKDLEKTLKILEDFTIEEVESLAKAAKEIILNRQRNAKKQGIANIVNIVLACQISLEEIVIALRDNNATFNQYYKNRLPQRLYQNPSNESEIWSGTGRTPKWLKHYLALGHDIEEFEMFKDIKRDNETLQAISSILDSCSKKNSSKGILTVGEKTTKNAGILFAAAQDDTEILEHKSLSSTKTKIKKLTQPSE